MSLDPSWALAMQRIVKQGVKADQQPQSVPFPPLSLWQHASFKSWILELC
jgi:hypothetical protein